jgi:hypothetical protein
MIGASIAVRSEVLWIVMTGEPFRSTVSRLVQGCESRDRSPFD